MKKITIVLVFILSIMLSYFSATGVNLHYSNQLRDHKKAEGFVASFIINGFETIDRNELIDKLMDVADEYSLLLSSGWSSLSTNEIYYYGDSKYLNHTLLNYIVRTSEKKIKLDDTSLLLNSYDEGPYGRIYTIGNLSSPLNNFEFYSFEAMKNNQISLDVRVVVTSNSGEQAIDLATQDLAQYFPTLEIFYAINEGSLSVSEFSWNDSIGTYLILSLLFIMLLVVLSIIIIIKKQQRYIAICRLHGISSRQITRELFGFFLLLVWLAFLVGTIAFDYLVIGPLAHYNILFYQIQAMIIVLVIIVLWIAFEISNRFVAHFSMIESIKSKAVSQKLFFGGLAIKFVIIVVLLSNYVSVYHVFIESYQTYSYYNQNQEEFSRISYIAGSMTDLSMEETILVSSEVYNQLQSTNTTLYCVESLLSSNELEMATLNGLNASMMRINLVFLERYLPEIALKIDHLDSTKEPIIVVPNSLQSKERQLKTFLEYSNYNGDIHYLKKVPEIPTYFGLPISSDHLIIIIDDQVNEYTGARVMQPCYIIEDSAGSTNNIDSIVSSTSNPDWLVAYSNEINFKRQISANQSLMIDYGVQLFLAISIVVAFFLMMLVLYLYTNLKLIVIKKNHGQSDLQVFSYFFIMNGIIYGSAVIYFALIGSLDWISFSLLLLFMIVEFIAIKIYLAANKKNFKQWLS